MRLDLKTELPAWALLAAMFAAAALTAISKNMPVDWGVATGHGELGRLLLVPKLALTVYILMLLLPHIAGPLSRYGRSSAYTLSRLVALVTLAAAHAAAVLPLRGVAVDANLVVPLAGGTLLILLAGSLGSFPFNSLVGLRTPWTLASKQAWAKTHRLGSALFLLMGAAAITAAVLRRGWAFGMMVAVINGSTLALILYSYHAWRAAPDKLTDPPPSDDRDRAD